MERIKIGTFEIKSGKVFISDPCYDTNVWCNDYYNAENGTYNIYIEKTDVDGWGNRISKLIAIHQDHETDNLVFDEDLGRFGVDSGTLGFFDKRYYDKFHKDETNDNWYDKYVCSCINNTYNFTDNRGVWCSSGCGDGMYNVDAVLNDKEKVIALMATFLDDEE